MKEIIIAVDDEMNYRDPLEAKTYNDILFLSCVSEPIVSISESGNVTPLAASDFKIEKNGCIIRFNFSGKSKWPSGEAVTSHDFENLFLEC